MKRLLLALCLALLLATGGSAQSGEPEIRPEEVVAPPLESDEPGWTPLYLHYEDPASVDCAGRQACQVALDNATAEAQK